MDKLPHELEFISIIKRDGSGTIPIKEKDIQFFVENKFAAEEVFRVFHLSISEKTFIAIGFNSYVVKLKQ